MEEFVMKEYKKILCKTMEAFVKFCSENKLSYMGCGGTAIGALRHGGIIPWDDDIDVYMPRHDYERFLANRKKLNNSQYRIATPGDENYHYSFSKFYDNTTTLVELPQFPNCVIGVFIDVFPLDEVSGDFEEIKRKKRMYDRLYDRYLYSFWKVSFRSICSHLYYRKFRNLFYMIYTKFVSHEKLNKIRDEFVLFDKERMKDKGDKVLTYISIYGLEKEVFNKEWFENVISIPFEYFRINIPSGYDKYLTQLYGDYMTPPPIEKQVTRHFHYYLNLKERLDSVEIKKRLDKGERTVM